ncbi:C-factor [Nymphon striatum]|nr:C-factor [Nymphon striatum]
MTTILITGAGRGIGFELARQSVQMGWNVLGSVRTVEAQKELAEKLPEMTVLNFDVTDHDAIEKGFAKTMATNVFAPLKVTQVFLPLLKQGSNPRMVNISSKMGRMEFDASDRIAYRASKSALNKVTQGLATDLKKDGITCIAMHPGWVQTDMGSSAADVTPQCKCWWNS